jgi:hypothetical protein
MAPRLCVLVLLVQLFSITPIAINFTLAQGLQTSPYSAPSVLRGAQGDGLDLAPSNPLGLPGSAYRGQAGSDTVSLSSGMFPGILPPIPNLQIGYLFNFGPKVRSGRFTADYLLPFSLSPESTVFGEAHTEFQSFWNTTDYNNRVDISLGGGYRTIARRNTLLGINGFYDTSRLGGNWYSSGSVGFEIAALLPGNDALDLNFNWYGNLFSGNVISNAFRYGPSNFDFQAGYSHQLWDRGPDLRLSATGYKFNAGNSVYGGYAQAELKSPDGMFVLRYNAGSDQINGAYQTVGGFMNVGLRLENILKGESPITMPEPIFKSPRNLFYMLTQTVNRNWHQPGAVVITRCESTNLSGYIFYTTSMVGWVSYQTVPPVPDIASIPNEITVCWSKATNTVSWYCFRIRKGGVTADYDTDGTGHSGFTVTPGSSCVRLKRITIGGTSYADGIALIVIGSATQNFDAGGGMSFSFP